MNDNVVPINANSRPSELSKKDQYIDWLTQLIDAIMDGTEQPDAMAIAVFTQTGPDIDVMCGGFRDDAQSIKYLTAFIRNQGFAQSDEAINDDDDHEDV